MKNYFNGNHDYFVIAQRHIQKTKQKVNVLLMSSLFGISRQAHLNPNFEPIKWENRFSKNKVSEVKSNFVSLKTNELKIVNQNQE